MEVRKTVKLRVVGDNENLKELEKLLAIWRYSVWQKRKGINIDNLKIPATYKNSLKQFNDFNISAFHPILFNTGFSIDFENNEVKLTSLKKHRRFFIKNL